MRQLAMYSYLIRGADKKDVSILKLYFLEAKDGDKNMIYATSIGENEIDLLVRDIKDYDQALKSGDWVNRPCYAKTYGKGDECEYCKLAKEVYKK